MRKLLFLSFGLFVTHLATGCCARPYVFPRLQAGCGGTIGLGCGAGGCGQPLFGGGPAILQGPATGGDPGFIGGYPAPGYDAGYAPPTGGPGCAGCGANAGPGGHPVASTGLPPGYAPSGYGPGSGYAPPPGYSYGPPAAPAPMPNLMPSAMPGGVPHDSALLKMPTIVPPGIKSKSEKPGELPKDLAGVK